MWKTRRINGGIKHHFCLTTLNAFEHEKNNTYPCRCLCLGDAPFYLGSYPLAATTYGVDGIAEVYADFRAFSAWPVEDVRSLGAYINARYGKVIALP
jgi:hypothetical protein